jgi:hypothetical protein
MAMTTDFMSAAMRKSGTLLRVAAVALAFGAVAGCDTVSDLFTSDDKTVLPGKRLSVMERRTTRTTISLRPARSIASGP